MGKAPRGHIHHARRGACCLCMRACVLQTHTLGTGRARMGGHQDAAGRGGAPMICEI